MKYDKTLTLHELDLMCKNVFILKSFINYNSIVGDMNYGGERWSR